MDTIILNDGKAVHFNTVRAWKELKVIEANLPENVEGLSFPWKDTDGYRIIINDRLSEREKLEVFIHEMIHIYRGDHKSDKNMNEIELECHQITHDILTNI